MIGGTNCGRHRAGDGSYHLKDINGIPLEADKDRIQELYDKSPRDFLIHREMGSSGICDRMKDEGRAIAGPRHEKTPARLGAGVGGYFFLGCWPGGNTAIKPRLGFASHANTAPGVKLAFAFLWAAQNSATVWPVLYRFQ